MGGGVELVAVGAVGIDISLIWVRRSGHGMAHATYIAKALMPAWASVRGAQRPMTRSENREGIFTDDCIYQEYKVATVRYDEGKKKRDSGAGDG